MTPLAKSKSQSRRPQGRPAATGAGGGGERTTGDGGGGGGSGAGATAANDEAKGGRRGRRRKGDETTATPAAPTRVVRPPSARSPRIRSKAPAGVEASTGDEKAGLRAKASQRMLKIGFMRRRYAKRLVRYIDRQKAKGRPLPPQFADLERFLSQVPKEQRAQRFEEALAMQQADDLPIGREMRRAAANQQRRSGKNPAGYRPGSAPRALQPRPPKGSRPR